MNRTHSGSLSRFTCVLMILLIGGTVNAQNITNTLGVGGVFRIKDSNVGSFLSVFQSDGTIGIGTNINLNYTTNNYPYGVIMKSGARFLHNFEVIGTNGHNTFLGLNAGNFTMNGVSFQASNNTGIGYASLFSLTTGSFNTAIGVTSLTNLTSGFHNIAVGYQTMYNISTGSYNICIGNFALTNTSSSSQNTVIGYNAALGINSGDNNILIGYSCSPSMNNISNEITLGNNSNNKLRCNVQSITSLSDARDKRNITELSLGLDFLCSIKPRQFNWDKREWYDNNISDGSKTENKLTAGFIAQELNEAQQIFGAEWLNTVSKDNPDKWEAAYGNLLPVVVKSIQELKTENDMLKNEVEFLRQQIALVIQEVESLKRMNGSGNNTAVTQRFINQFDNSTEEKIKYINGENDEN